MDEGVIISHGNKYQMCSKKADLHIKSARRKILIMHGFHFIGNYSFCTFRLTRFFSRKLLYSFVRVRFNDVLEKFAPL